MKRLKILSLHALLILIPLLSGAPRAESEFKDMVEEFKNIDVKQHIIDSVMAHNDLSIPHSQSSAPSPAIEAGEQLYYNVKWGFIKGGMGLLKLDKTENQNLQITILAQSSLLVDPFKKIRNIMKTIVDPRQLYPYVHQEEVREGNYRDTRWEYYDQQQQQIMTHKTKGEWDSIAAETHNTFSLLYHLRTRNYSVGDTFTVACYTGKKVMDVFFSVPERAKIEVDYGTFHCFALDPVIAGKEDFTQKDKLRIWISDDELKLPVLLRSKLKWGSLVMELEDRRVVAAAPAAPVADTVE